MDLVGFFLDALIAGVYLFVAVYHLQIWLRRREERPYLWLSLACVSALLVNLTGLRTRFVDATPGSISSVVANRLGMGLTCVFLVEFVSSFRGRPTPSVLRLLGGAVILLTFATPLAIGWIDLVTMLSCLVLMLVAIGLAIGALRAGTPEVGPVAVGFGLLGIGLVGDLLGQLRVLAVPEGYLAIFGFFALFLAMAWSLSLRFERTHRELDLLRQDLEMRVAERTAVLEGANRKLRRYFPVSVIDRILRAEQEDAPKTERRTVTVLFSDLADFTAFSDGVDPQTVTSILNDYLRAMFEEIDSCGGTVDKVMGDGIMAIWGAPASLSVEEQAGRAVAAALGMQRRLALLSREWTASGLEGFSSRIGIHQDVVAVGDIGAEGLWSFTVIGGGVNLASRLEGACQPGRILVSSAVHRHVAGRFPFEGAMSLSVKGVRDPVVAHSLDPSQGE